MQSVGLGWAKLEARLVAEMCSAVLGSAVLEWAVFGSTRLGPPGVGPAGLIGVWLVWSLVG